MKRTLPYCWLLAALVGAACTPNLPPESATGGSSALGGTGGKGSDGGAGATDGGTRAGGGGNAGASFGGSLVGGSDNSPTGGKGGAGGARATGGTMGDGGSSTGGGASRLTLALVGSGDWGQEAGRISVYRLDRGKGELQLLGDAPAGGLASFLAVDTQQKRVYAVDEKNGGLLSYTIEPDTGKLTALGATSNSNHPVHLVFSPDGKYVIGANYNEGSVDVYPIGTDGKAQPSSQTFATGSHAHSSIFDAAGRLLVMNEGADKISLLTFSGGKIGAASPAEKDSFSPRHSEFGPDGRLYVVSERGDHVTAFDRGGDGALEQIWQEKRLDQGSPTDNTGADIHVTPNGRFLYASNRGSSNTLVQFDIGEAAPKLLGHVTSGGDTPRNFSIDPDGQFVLVGNHGNKKTLVLLRIGADGKLSPQSTLDVGFSPYFARLVQF